MKKHNHNGFGLVEGVLIILILAVASFGGWYVWHTQKAKPVVTNSSTPVTTSTTPTTSTSPTANQKYLNITEWGLKLPLSVADRTAYYTIQTIKVGGNPVGAGVSIFDNSIDRLKNPKGVSCKDLKFPLFIIQRVNKSYALQAANPKDDLYDPTTAYKTLSLDSQKNYEFSGVAAHQAAPTCSYSTEDSTGNTIYQNILDKYTVVEEALTESYEKIQVQ